MATAAIAGSNTSAARLAQRVSPTPRVSYDAPAVLLASQFMLAAGAEHLLLECSAGVAPWSHSAADELPVHTRLGLTWPAAERLARLLNQALTNRNASASCNDAPPPAPHVSAQWPQFEG